jgi:hypothetical protein
MAALFMMAASAHGGALHASAIRGDPRLALRHALHACRHRDVHREAECDQQPEDEHDGGNVEEPHADRARDGLRTIGDLGAVLRPVTDGRHHDAPQPAGGCDVLRVAVERTPDPLRNVDDETKAE